MRTEAQGDSPLVSVVILNYKRLNALALSLDSALAQNYSNREIIVVDNHSEEDVEGLVRSRSADVKLIQLPQNLGTCGGRNAGIREARGQIIITIDDDINFASEFELSKVVKTFKARPDIAVLAFQLIDAKTGALRLREWCHPRSWIDFGQTEFETHFFIEGAVACRREVFEAVGLYYEPLFIGNEGWDLGLRILDRGFRMLYTPHIRVRHLMSPEARSSVRTYHNYTRNYIWIAHKDYPVLAGLRFLAPKLGMMLFFALRTGYVGAFLKGLWHGIAGLSKIHAERTPVSWATLRYMAELEKWRPNLWFRLARHRSSPQI